MESRSDTKGEREYRAILVSWLWMSLVVGVFSMAAVVAAGIDYGNPSQFPLVAVELVIVGVPAGLVFGAIVWAAVALVWVLTRRPRRPRMQAILSPVAALLSSGMLFYAFFSLFPVAFPLILYALVVPSCFAAVYFFPIRRLIARRTVNRSTGCVPGGFGV